MVLYYYKKFEKPPLKQLNAPHGKPRDIFKGKIPFIAASCGELNPVDFASLSK